MENRNHWRRDALWGEDETRSRDPNLVANLALVRSAVFRLLNQHFPDRSHSELREAFAANPSVALFTAKYESKQNALVHARHPPMRLSVVFIPPAPAPLVAPRNLAPAVETSFRPLSLRC